jgi:hemerythrin
VAYSLKINWDESLATGDRSTDVRHKFLIDLIKDLAEVIEEEKDKMHFGRVLNILKYYTEWHFNLKKSACIEIIAPS